VYHCFLLIHVPTVTLQIHAVIMRKHAKLDMACNLCKYCRMRIVCPECQAAYNLGPMIKNAILVCHKCNTEFDTYGHRITAHNPVQQVFKAQEAAAPTFGLHDLMQSGMNNSRPYIWLWMILVLLFLSAVGSAVRWEHWQLQGTIRGFSLQAEEDAPVQDRDWRILPETVSTQWLEREDHSLALLVEGRVQNMVNLALPLPEIQLLFITQTGENIENIQVITEPAGIATLQAVPFTSPPIDEMPVVGLGQRGFMLLVEDAPDSTVHILLHALAVQRQGMQQKAL